MFLTNVPYDLYLDKEDLRYARNSKNNEITPCRISKFLLPFAPFATPIELVRLLSLSMDLRHGSTKE
jgi:hypothetical protein